MAEVVEIIDDTSHAKYSASSGERWINCPASMQMAAEVESMFPQGNKENIHAWAGTVAHELAHRELTQDDYAEDHVGVVFQNPADEALKYHFTSDDAEALFVYTNKCATQEADDKFYEERVNYSDWVLGQEGFGTLDFAAVKDTTLTVRDLKFGMTPVTSVTQLKLYALGVLDDVLKHCFIEEVSLEILQPRINHELVETYSVQELYEWAQNVVVPAVEDSLSDDPTFNVNVDGWCHFCPAKNICRPWADEILSVLSENYTGEIEDLKMVDGSVLSVAEQAEVLNFMKKLSKEEDALKNKLTEAAKKGDEVPGFKLVFWNDTFSWKDPDKAFEFLIDEGCRKEELIEEKMISAASAKKMIGINHEELSSHIQVKKGNLILVSNSTRRKAVTKADLDKLQEDETDSLQETFENY